MNEETNDQGWQRIQSRIDLLASQFLKEDYPAIEYKSKHCRSFAIAAGA